jgi:type I restriction enzyme, S subunit
MTGTVQALEPQVGVASNLPVRDRTQTGGWKLYPEYKESGVEWLGRVPDSWSIKRGKALFHRKQRPVRKEDEIVTCFRDGTVTLRKNRRTEGFTNALKEIGYQGVRKGNLVIHVMDAFAGAIGVSDSDGKSTPVYLVCEPRQNVSTKYYAYLLREMSRAGFIQALAKGIRERSTDFRYDTFGALRFCLPSADEQDAIVRYLDHYDRLIRKSIRTKQKLIALLTEQKQAIIQDAVTRGLNPDVKLKPSGNDCIGNIPQEWSIVNLRTLLAPCSERNRPDLPLLSVVRECGVIVRDIENIESNHNFIPEDLGNYKVVRRGQFAMNKMKAWQGSYGVSEYDGIVSPAYFVFDLPEHVCGQFFNLAIRSRVYVPLFFRASDGVRVGQWDLSVSAMKEIPFALPPIDQQRAISRAVPPKLEPLDCAINTAKREIDLMREYRTRLTADVVTGKIDVRETAAALPVDLADLVGDDDALTETVDDDVEVISNA